MTTLPLLEIFKQEQWNLSIWEKNPFKIIVHDQILFPVKISFKCIWFHQNTLLSGHIPDKNMNDCELYI